MIHYSFKYAVYRTSHLTTYFQKRKKREDGIEIVMFIAQAGRTAKDHVMVNAHRVEAALVACFNEHAYLKRKRKKQRSTLIVTRP